MPKHFKHGKRVNVNHLADPTESIMAPDGATVFVIDDDPAMLDSLRWLLDSVDLSAQCFASADEFLERYDPDSPGCLLLDIRMPEKSGLELQQELTRREITIPIIFLTAHGDVPVAVQAMTDGAFRFIEKPFSKQLLLEGVHEALKRDAQLRLKATERADIAARLAALSSRQTEVMELIVAGLLHKQIATRLGISERTVESHRRQLMEKLGIDSVVDLVKLALLAQADG